MSKSTIIKILVLLAIVVVAGGLTHRFGGTLSLEELAARESELRELQRDRPVIVFAIAFGIYVAVTGLSLPGAAILSLVYGWLFGLGTGLVLVSFASTAGATLAFLLSRYLFRDGLQSRFGTRLQTFNDNLEREGAYYLFTLRLILAVPFFVINVVMGLTRMSVWTFWWVSQIGMLPGTIVYIYAGSSFPSLQDLAEQGPTGIINGRILTAFVLLGLFPIVVKRLMGGRGSGPPPGADDLAAPSES